MLLILCAAACLGTVYFEEDFEAGMGRWTASAWKSAARGVCVTVWRRCRALMSTSGTATPNQAKVKNTLGIAVIAALALVLFRLQDLKT